MASEQKKQRFPRKIARFGVKRNRRRIGIIQDKTGNVKTLLQLVIRYNFFGKFGEGRSKLCYIKNYNGHFRTYAMGAVVASTPWPLAAAGSLPCLKLARLSASASESLVLVVAKHNPFLKIRIDL